LGFLTGTKPTFSSWAINIEEKAATLHPMTLSIFYLSAMKPGFPVLLWLSVN
jgi:hypothetical protein